MCFCVCVCVCVCVYALFSSFEAYVTDFHGTWGESSTVKGHTSEVNANLYHFNTNIDSREHKTDSETKVTVFEI